MLNRLYVLLAATVSASVVSPAFGQDIPIEPMVGDSQRIKDEDAYLEFVRYEQILHSSTQGTVAGENTDLQAAFRFLVHDEGFFRIRFNTDPERNRLENSTSRLELVMNHRLGDFEIQADLDLRFTGEDETVGPDDGSDKFFISYQPTKNIAVTLYPYNFDGDLGWYFYQNDINRMFYIEGTPESIPQFLPENDDTVFLRNKTLPGFDIQWRATENLILLVGGGAGRYLYPSDPDFDIESTTTAESWEARTNTGYKLGLEYRTPTTNIIFRAVSQDSADETGALIESAANLRAFQNIGRFQLSLEASYSRAGQRAYELNNSANWFVDRGDYAPIFSDENGEKEDWLGQSGSAYLLRASYQFDKIAPYIHVGSMSEHFVFNEIESAHRLRTSDGTRSHGGLRVYGLGANFTRGNYVISPEFEYFVAKNNVFFNQTDLRRTENLANRNNKESRITVFLTYML